MLSSTNAASSDLKQRASLVFMGYVGWFEGLAFRKATEGNRQNMRRIRSYLRLLRYVLNWTFFEQRPDAPQACGQ
jgi:hypothetical protein